MNLLVTGAWKCTEKQLNELNNLGHEVVFMQCEKDDLPCDYGWVQGVICNGLFLHHPIEKFSCLKYIQLTSAGYDRVPMDYIREHDIEIHNAKGVYSIPMAEFAVSGVLQLYKQSRFFYGNQKNHRWEKHRGLLELNGKTVLIVGCGDVGRECAKRFSAFGCRVTGVNRSKTESEYFDEIHSLDEIDSIISTADVVVLSIALADQTKHLINSKRLEKLKSTAVLVNISRGALVDMKALEEAIDNIGGAVLDVFEEEPLDEESVLWDKENVIISPHNSFVGDGDGERLNSLIINSLERK